MVAEGAYHGLVDEDRLKITQKAKTNVNSWEGQEKPEVDLATWIKSDLGSYA